MPLLTRAVFPPPPFPPPRPSLGLKRYTLHPTDANWLLATNSKHELLLSQDLGATWKSIANRVFDFAWGRAAGEGWSKESIVAVMLDDGAPVPPADALTKTLSLCLPPTPPLPHLHPPH